MKRKLMLAVACVILLSGCETIMHEATVYDAHDNQIIRAEFVAGSTVKYKDFEVSSPPPKASIIEDVARGVSGAATAMMPILMLDAISD